MAPEGAFFLVVHLSCSLTSVSSRAVIHNFKQGYSAKADIWSLGCVCLEMFAGRRPWSDDEAIQAMFKVRLSRVSLARAVADPIILAAWRGTTRPSHSRRRRSFQGRQSLLEQLPQHVRSVASFSPSSADSTLQRRRVAPTSFAAHAPFVPNAARRLVVHRHLAVRSHRTRPRALLISDLFSLILARYRTFFCISPFCKRCSDLGKRYERGWRRGERRGCAQHRLRAESAVLSLSLFLSQLHLRSQAPCFDGSNPAPSSAVPSGGGGARCRAQYDRAFRLQSRALEAQRQADASSQVRMDTGTGKTLVAIMLIRHITSLPTPPGDPPSLVVCIVPTVNLVTQQSAAIAGQTNLRVKGFSGSMVRSLSLVGGAARSRFVSGRESTTGSAKSGSRSSTPSMLSCARHKYG